MKELLQVEDERVSCSSLPLALRLHRLQVRAVDSVQRNAPTQRRIASKEFLLRGVQVMKRASDFDFRISHRHCRVRLQLSADGRVLQLIQDNTTSIGKEEATQWTEEQASIRLESIQNITVHSDATFSIHTTSDASPVLHQAVLTAETVEMTRVWVISLVCAVNASTTAEKKTTAAEDGTSQLSGLIWQALRLRIFELSSVLPLSLAIRVMFTAYASIIHADRGYAYPDIPKAFLIQLEA